MKKQLKQHRKWYDRTQTPTVIKGPSRTSQADKGASDVNLIVARFQRTGELPPNPRGLEGRYEDVTGLQEDLTDAYNKAIENTENYNRLLAEQEKEKNELNEKTDKKQQDTKQQDTDTAVGAEGEDKGA